MIDLGVLERDEVPPVPVRGRGRMPPRWLAVPVALALAGLGLAGDIASGSAGLTVLTSLPVSTGARATIMGDTLYVAEAAGTDSRLTAYRLGDGRVRWTTPVPLPAAVLNLQDADGVLLASIFALGEPMEQTVVLDEETGRTLWGSSDVLVGLVPAQHRALLTHLFPIDLVLDPGAPPADQLGTEVAAVDLRDGRVAWRYRMAAGCEHAVDAVPAAGARMAVLCPTDPTALPTATSATYELRGVDLATGQAGAAVALTLPVVPPPGGLVQPHQAGPVLPLLSMAAGQILVGAAGDNAGTVMLTVYDPTTLRPLWTRQMSDADYNVTPCAGQLCLDDAYGLAVVDPGTGTVRWHTAQQALDTSSPGSLVGGLLVVPSGATGAQLVDAGTGRPVLDVSGWRVVAGGSGALPMFARWQPHPDGRVWFATVSVDPPALRPVGFAPDVLQDGCSTEGDYLACLTLTQTLRVWRYRG